MQECSGGHKQSKIQLWIAPFVSSHVGDDACRHWIDAQYQRQLHRSCSFFWHRPPSSTIGEGQQPCNILVPRLRVQLLMPRIHQVGSHDRIASRISTKWSPSTKTAAKMCSSESEQSVARHCSHVISKQQAFEAAQWADIWNWSCSEPTPSHDGSKQFLVRQLCTSRVKQLKWQQLRQVAWSFNFKWLRISLKWRLWMSMMVIC